MLLLLPPTQQQQQQQQGQPATRPCSLPSLCCAPSSLLFHAFRFAGGKWWRWSWSWWWYGMGWDEMRRSQKRAWAPLWASFLTLPLAKLGCLPACLPLVGVERNIAVPNSNNSPKSAPTVALRCKWTQQGVKWLLGPQTPKCWPKPSVTVAQSPLPNAESVHQFLTTSLNLQRRQSTFQNASRAASSRGRMWLNSRCSHHYFRWRCRRFELIEASFKEARERWVEQAQVHIDVTQIQSCLVVRNGWQLGSQ